MTKLTSPLPTAALARPQLSVVTRRRTARLIGVGFMVVFGLMLGAAAFQTQLARRQLELDTLDRDIRDAHSHYDVLRRERAELRSPGRLATEAGSLGMIAASQTQFVTLDPDDLATVQRAGAPVSDDAPTDIESEFAEYAKVKAQAGEAP